MTAPTSTNLGIVLPDPNVSTDWGYWLNDAIGNISGGAYSVKSIDAIFAGNGTGSSVGLNIGAGKTIAIAGTAAITGTFTQNASSYQFGGTGYFGSGNNTASPVAFTLRGADATGTNLTGVNLTLRPGNGTGTGGSGSFIVQIAPAGSSGTTANTMTAGMTLSNAGNLTLNVSGSQLRRSDTYEYTSVLTGTNAQTGTTYTLQASDAGKLVTMSNASANTLTIPANSSVAFPVGTRIDIVQLGAGQTTIAITSDTLVSYSGYTKLVGQYAGASIVKIASTQWALVGNIT
jgi:hypothetical protein